MKKHILFVEDDNEYRSSLTKILKDEGYRVDSVGSPLEAIELFATNKFDLVISDLVMEELNGIQFLKYIKKVNPHMKTIILTADPTNDTELAALDIFVDKYLMKGASYPVLLKHIENLLAQQSGIAGNRMVSKIEYVPENLVVNFLSRTVTKNGEQINITTKEFDILKVLLLNKGTALNREEIIEQIWDNAYENIDERVVDVHIRSIRKKLRTQAILSIRGYGYKWEW